MIRRLYLIISIWAFLSVPLFGSVTDDAAKRVMDAYAARLLAGDFQVGELFGELYIKEYVDVKKQSLVLNIIPDLARFDSEKQKYLSEFFYEIHYVDNAVPDIRRRAHLTSYKRGNGEIDRVLYYMNPDFLHEKLFKAQYLSPIYPTNYNYYNYTIDSTYNVPDGGCKILFTHKFDNIKLLTNGWVVFDASHAVRSFYAEGWDEQSRFAIECRMGDEGLERFVVKDLSLKIFYDFALNELDIDVDAQYTYSSLSTALNNYNSKSRFDLTGLLNADWDSLSVETPDVYVTMHRPCPLTAADSLIYIKKGVIKTDTVALWGNSDKPKRKSDKVLRWLWDVGDEMISSHHLNWGDSDLKVYPLINPSYMRYSTGKGVTYKFALNLQSRMGKKHSFSLKPMLGYSFKRNEFYWGVNGYYVFDPRHRGMVQVNAGRENSIYREFEVEKIKDLEFPDIRFSEMAFTYYRDSRFAVNLQREWFNGFDVQLGLTYYYRSLYGNAVGQIVDGEKIKRKYRSFAPHLQFIWHPGMYHYYDGDKKVNLGSRMPRFSLDIEQGVRGPLDSKSVYTRAEFDVQYKHRLSSSATLNTRLGFGGYLYEKDLYFINYTFLKDNILPLDKDDELSGVFQLLDGEWYNSANRYFRANAAYVSPFLVWQKMLPQVKFIKNEMLFFNLLFISKLHPYCEVGYGVETPYVDLGIFAGFENTSFHKIGCKITISLFED